MIISDANDSPAYKPAYEIFMRPEDYSHPEINVYIYTDEHVSHAHLDVLREHLKEWAQECGLGEMKERE